MSRYDLYDVEAAIEALIDEAYQEGYDEGALKGRGGIPDIAEVFREAEEAHYEHHTVRFPLRQCSEPLCRALRDYEEAL